MTLTGENRSTGRKICPYATLSLTNLTRTGSRSKPSFRAERPSTELPSLGVAFKDKSYLNYI